MKFRVSLAFIVLPAIFLQGGAQSSPQQSAPPATGDSSTAAEKYFTDAILTDQNGKELRFYTDLLKNKIVVINSFYASPHSSCAALQSNLAAIQKSLGQQMETDARILSITVDPETDTPARLKDLATQLGARPGWYFLTGKKENVEFILKKLGMFVPNKEDHITLFMIGNVRTGLWKKVLGFSKPEDLISAVRSMMQDNQ